MKKVLEIGTIIITTILSLANLLRLIPQNSDVGKWINTLFVNISNKPILFALYLFVIIGLGSLVIFKAASDIKKERKKHVFELGSIEFNEFFSNWYSKEGDINIISNDLNWTVSTNGNAIFDSLKAKCISKDKVILYLKKPREGEEYDQYTKELMDLGATVKIAPETLVNSYTYSTLIYMGAVTSVIVRKKNSNQGEKIVFEEIEDEYVSGVLTALIEVN